HITKLLSKIKPAIESDTQTPPEQRNGNNGTFVYKVTEKNVFLTVQKVREQSSILKEMEETKQIKIIGGLYDVDSGQVTFYESA
ncbi:MAG TPA: carbonic anhydrase, partial [Ferruginibacter sp.]|nr:carbonic anhydrase [Ferruginibacter sp.]